MSISQPIRTQHPRSRRQSSLLGCRIGCLVSLTLLTLLGPGHLLVQATQVQQWQVDPAAQQLELWLAAGVTPEVNLLQAPPRIVIDLPGVTVASSQTQTYTGTIRQVRLGQFQPDRARMVIELAPGTPLTQETVRLQRVVGTASEYDRWVLSPVLTAATRADALQATNPGPLSASGPPAIPDITVAAGGPASLADDLPPAQFFPPPGSQPVTVQVPSLTQPNPPSAIGTPSPVPPAPVSVPSPPVAGPLPPATVTPAMPAPLPTPTAPPTLGVTTVPVLPVPSVTPAPTAPLPPAASWQSPAPVPAPMAPVPSGNHIQFGQPLPTGKSPQAPAMVAAPPQPLAWQAPPTSARLAAGSWVPLVYTGQVPLALQNGVPHPEVLLLQENLLDSRGHLLAPAGSRVLGRFESGRDGSRFITQAIEVNGTSRLFAATSLWMQGDRHVPSQKLWRNSGIAAAAGMVLTGFTGVGLLAGAAMGLAGTYAVAPQPATIQPGQVIMVQVLEPIP